MKKLISALLALSLLLSGLCALAESEPTVFEDVGIAVDFEDVMAISGNYQLLAGEAVDTAAAAGAVKNDNGEYHVIVYDMDGNPVEGAVIQLCDDTTCAFQPTDANGVATFAVEAQKVYDVHVLMAPEGYAPDDDVYKTLDTYSDVNIFLEKAA